MADVAVLHDRNGVHLICRFETHAGIHHVGIVGRRLSTATNNSILVPAPPCMAGSKVVANEIISTLRLREIIEAGAGEGQPPFSAFK